MTGPRPRTAVLWSVGRGIASASESSALRRAVLSIAVYFVVLGSVAAVAALCLQAARDQRITDTGLTLVGDEAPLEQQTLIRETSDSTDGSRPYAVVYFDPQGPHSPIPSGLPADGLDVHDVFLSPALHELQPEVADRYGEYAGSIAPSGLADPGELLVYAVADLDEYPDAYGVTAEDSAFVYSPHALLLDQDFIPAAVWVLLAVVVLIPAVALTIAASRIGEDARNRRMTMLEVLGARRRDRTVIAFAESADALLIGAAAAIATLCGFMIADVRLPHIGYVVSAADLRDSLGTLALTAVAGATLAAALGTIGAYSAMARRNRTRPSAATGIRMPKLWIGLFALAFIAMVLLPSHFYGTPDYHTAIWFATAALLLTVWPMTMAVSYQVARSLTDAGSSRDWPIATLVARRVQAAPKSFGRPLATIVFANVLIIMIATYQGLLTDVASRMQRWFETSPQSMVEVYGAKSGDGADLQRWREALPAGLESVATFVEEPESPGGSPKLLTYWDCDEGVAAALCGSEVTWTEFDETVRSGGNVELPEVFAAEAQSLGVETVVVADLDSVDTAQRGVVYIVFDPEGGRVDSEAVKAAGAVLPGGAQVLYPGEANVLGGIPHWEQSRWLTGIGAVGVTLLGLAMLVAFSTRFGRDARRLAPLSMMTGDRSIYRRLAIASVAVPILAATASGIVIGQVATTTLRQHIESPATVPWTAVLLGVNAAAAIAIGVWAARAALRYRDRWKPSGE
jgi:hypothetical protein